MRWAIRSVRPLIRFQALPIRMAKVLVLMPPPVLPGFAPMNISSSDRPKVTTTAYSSFIRPQEP